MNKMPSGNPGGIFMGGAGMSERHRRSVAPGWRSTVLILLSLLVPSLTAAQVIAGRVLDEATGDILPSAEVRLLAPDGTIARRMMSDSTGTFRMLAPAPGQYMLEGVLFGYGTARSALLEIGRNREVVVELRLSRTAVVLAPVRVIANRTYGNTRLSAFYERADNARRTGIGKITTREDIERLKYGNVRNFAPNAHTLRDSYEEVSEPKPGCYAATYLDGTAVSLREITQGITWENLEGVEFYEGFDIPFQFRTATGPCAIVLYWTRDGARGGSPLSLTRAAVALAAILAIILVAR
jgi:hypothetical protein